MVALRTSIVMLLAALCLALSACGGAQANSSSGGGDDAQPATQERAQRQSERRGDREDGPGDRPSGRSGDREGQKNAEGREIRAATLELSGDEGTVFSGVCKIGEREMKLEGTVPETVELDLDGEPLECSIENTGDGSLKADLSVGNAHYTQQTSASGASLNFALSGDGYTSSTSSVTAIDTETPDAVSNASSYAEAGPQDEK